ncbi:Interactor protein for cytohesin exchange factors 1 [Nibea albiflora]|uniref:Interactor protein for cytohesin exchange factors 1 n=1 Tax=Nibea albiflora TaxID=240163 RepID=A0ACB7FB12_NIBAL|nr:Interactor protein for cytohesin exchange factors 1 [Nibea albiflora]
MSRRRVSVKDLGALDCQGWLHRRKDSRSFLGSRWKRYWFVLQRSSLYWYTDKEAEKAEGFINLSGFTIEQAKQCRKKHAMTASHPLVVTIFMAAESFTDMNNRSHFLFLCSDEVKSLKAAVALKASCPFAGGSASCQKPSSAAGETNTEECYSEDSDQEGDECTPEQETEESDNGDGLQPLCESSSSPTPLTEDGGGRRRSTSEGAPLCRNSRRRAATHGGERLSWQEQPRPEGGERAASLPLIHINEEEEAVHEKPPDEMESLYNHLRAASLSPIGGAKRKDFRASFIRRCENNKMNEKLHVLRILSSTLKAKELELQAVEQLLTQPALTASIYRTWRTSNSILLEEISQRNQAAGGAAELRPPET